MGDYVGNVPPRVSRAPQGAQAVWRYIEDTADHNGIELWALTRYNKDRDSMIVTGRYGRVEISVAAVEDSIDPGPWILDILHRISNPSTPTAAADTVKG